MHADERTTEARCRGRNKDKGGRKTSVEGRRRLERGRKKEGGERREAREGKRDKERDWR
jgi:hypothetical protein